MPDIHLEKTIDAAPSTIYRALTSQDGLRSFWTSVDDALPRCAFDWAMVIGRLDSFATTRERVPYFAEPTSSMS